MSACEDAGFGEVRESAAVWVGVGKRAILGGRVTKNLWTVK